MVVSGSQSAIVVPARTALIQGFSCAEMAAVNTGTRAATVSVKQRSVFINKETNVRQATIVVEHRISRPELDFHWLIQTLRATMSLYVKFCVLVHI